MENENRRRTYERLGWSFEGVRKERERRNCMKSTIEEVIKGQKIQHNNSEISKIKMEDEWKELFRKRVEEAKYLKKRSGKNKSNSKI